MAQELSPPHNLPLERLVTVTPITTLALGSDRDAQAELDQEALAMAYVLGLGLRPEGHRDPRLFLEVMRQLREAQARKFSLPADSTWRDIQERIES